MTDTAAMAASPSPRRGGLRRSARSRSGNPPALRSRESRSPAHAANRSERGPRRRRGSSPVGGRRPSAGRGQRSGERGRSRQPRSRSNGPPALESRARSATRSPSSGPPALESHSPENARSRGEPGRGDDRRSRSASPDPFSATDAETRRIMQNRVVTSARDQYEGQNIRFILWIFDDKDHYGHILAPALLAALTTEVERDRARRTERGAPSKKRDYARALIRKWLKNIDADLPKTHPILLKDLTYTIYSRYLNTFKKSVRTRNAEGGQTEIRLSPSAFDGALSALSHLYTGCGLDKSASKDL